MQKERYSLGPTPCEEDCAQIGDDNYTDRSLRECRAFILAIKAVCGEPPEGAVLRVVSERHDFGNYREVAVEFDGNDLC